ncbi:MAG: hypothetical protein ACJAS4_001817 [Bacteriovoracaceae bacterium]|jgi:hypothetical protein
MKVILLIFVLVSCVGQQALEPENKAQNEELITSCDYSNISSSLRTPKTIDEVTDLINALPKPLSLPCFIESLSRPLKVSLTLSKLSAQPAVGNDTPRIFLFIDNLILSVAPDGKGKDLLELSLLYTDRKSLKAELEFPIYEEISYTAGFDRIDIGGRSSCNGCHNAEAVDPSITNAIAYTSVAIKPETYMDLTDFQHENYKCELATNLDYRCQMIMSLFKFDQLDSEIFRAGTPRWIDTVL